MNFNSTRPLSYDSTDNQIINPFITTLNDNEEHDRKSPKPLKRAKSIVSPKSLSALFTRNKRSSIRRKRRSLILSTNEQNSSFTCQDCGEYLSSSTNSDLESLPDLTDDEYTPESTPIKPVPNCYFTTIEEPPRFDFKKLYNLKDKLVDEPVLLLQPSIFEIPEILYKIISYVDCQNSILPQESSPIRRRPLSYKHAMLIHGNKELAERALLEQQQLLLPSRGSPLLNCLLVNKMFYKVTCDVLSQKFYSSDETQLTKFIDNQGVTTVKFQPTLFILHKLFQTKQPLFDQVISHINFSNLSWFELYMCPKILPPISIFQQCGTKLKKLIITGSKIIDDSFVSQLSKYCPNLETIDFRASELISDFGIYQISNHCKRLKSINFGRKNKGHFITDSSISRLIEHNRELNTIGLAGCFITDKTLFEIAYKLPNITRLSLNNCHHLSNHSISMIFSNSHFFQKLSVLELRFNLQIVDLKSLIEFKRRQKYHHDIILLLELCETLMYKMRQQEFEMDKLISQKIFQDISDWANDYNDGDLSYQEIVQLTTRQQHA
ncbi:AMN1 Antagonist of mitotic exit network protein 1 [Candida maltosa Xu316]